MNDLTPYLGLGLWAVGSLVYLIRILKTEKWKNWAMPSFSLLEVLGAFTIFFLTYALILPTALKITPPEWPKEIVGLSLFVTTFFLYCLICHASVFPYFKKSGFRKGFLSWFIVFPLVVLFSQLADQITQYFTGSAPHEQMAVLALKGADKGSWTFVVLLIFIVFLVPVLEETLFRGFLQNSLRKWITPVGSIIFTSIVFALFHYSPQQGWTNVTILSSLFLLSCFLGALVEKYQSLRASIGLHATFNGMSALFILIKEMN